MIKRKLAGIFLATTMIMGTLAGCGDSGNSSTAAKVNTDESAPGKKCSTFIAGIRSSRTDLNILRSRESFHLM